MAATLLPLRKPSWRGISSHEPSSPSTPAITAILTAKRIRIALILTTAILLLFLLFPLPHQSQSQTPSPISISNTTTPLPSPSLPPTDWTRFAYIQYATNSIYLCNALVLFATLHHLGSLPDRLLLFPATMLDDPTSRDFHLLLLARHTYNVTLSPITIQSRPTNDPTWAESFTKLLAFNQTQYARVLSLDADALLLKPLDHLFLLPLAATTPIAMPRAYWLYPDTQILSSQLMLITPSTHEFSRVMRAVAVAGKDDYDMEIVNRLYRDSAMVLPHRGYDLLTREFMNPPDKHTWYLGGSSDDDDEWDPVAVLEEASFLHFSDWPVPKPWMPENEKVTRENEPKCWEGREKVEACKERDMWNGFREEFREKRERICGWKRP